MPTEPDFICPTCGRGSWNPNDAANKYCSVCGFADGSLSKEPPLLEASVTVDGVALTDAQVCTLRVALSGFLMQLSEQEFASQLGPIAENYRAHGGQLEAMLVNGGNARLAEWKARNRR